MIKRYEDKFQEAIKSYKNYNKDIENFMYFYMKFEHCLGFKYKKRNSNGNYEVDWDAFEADLKVNLGNSQYALDEEEKKVKEKIVKKYCISINDFKDISPNYKNDYENLKNVIKILRTLKRIRNNLFHGSKGKEIKDAANGERDYKIMEWATHLLKCLIIRMHSLDHNTKLYEVADKFFYS